MKLNIFLLIFLIFFIFLTPESLATENKEVIIAECGASDGYSFSSYIDGEKIDNPNWRQEKITNHLFLKKTAEGNLDILHGSKKFGFFSTLKNDGQIKFVSNIEDAATIAVAFPNRTVETYIFQKIDKEKYQVHWTQTITEIPFRKVVSWRADCQYIAFHELIEFSTAN